MRRSLIALAIAMVTSLAAAPPALADAVEDNIDELEGDGSYKVRVAAAVALAKTPDDRAVLALSRALRGDRDAAVRRAAALALKKVVTASTRKKVAADALAALRGAAKDKDKKVRKAAEKTLDALEAILATKAPKVFVNIDPPVDRTKKAGADAVSALARAVRAEVTRGSKEYAVEWPGDLPTGDELDQYGTQAFIVAASVSKLTMTTRNGRVEIACTIEIRVGPWTGSDGKEKWSAGQTGKATGSGKATTGTSTRAQSTGVVDCVSAVAEQLTSDKVVPFIKGLASSK
jgi:HEAT repeat protein